MQCPEGKPKSYNKKASPGKPLWVLGHQPHCRAVAMTAKCGCSPFWSSDSSSTYKSENYVWFELQTEARPSTDGNLFSESSQIRQRPTNEFTWVRNTSSQHARMWPPTFHLKAEFLQNSCWPSPAITNQFTLGFHKSLANSWLLAKRLFFQSSFMAQQYLSSGFL